MTVALQIEQVGKTEVGKSKTHMECNGHWRRASSTGTGDQRQHSSTPTLPMAFPTQGQKWSKTSMHRSVTAQCLERSGRTMRHETHSWFQLPAHSAGESSALCWCPSRWLLPPPLALRLSSSSPTPSSERLLYVSHPRGMKPGSEAVVLYRATKPAAAVTTTLQEKKLRIGPSGSWARMICAAEQKGPRCQHPA